MAKWKIKSTNTKQTLEEAGMPILLMVIAAMFTLVIFVGIPHLLAYIFG